jgi:hypothetical protein
MATGLQIAYLLLTGALVSCGTVAYIVPIHPPKFEYLNKLLASKHNYDVVADFYVVFDSQETIDMWNPDNNNLMNVFPTVYGGDQDLKKLHPVFFKKFWMAELIASRYDYLIMVDSDVEFTKAHDPYLVAKEISDRGLVYGCQSCLDCVHKLIPSTMSRFSAEDQAYLHSQLGNSTIYTWFNEIPVLETKTLMTFLTEYKITSTPPTQFYRGNQDYNMVLDFDHMAYQFYMIVRHGWKVVDLTGVTGSYFGSVGENGGGNEAAVTLSRPHWVAKFARDDPKFKDCNVVMVFHTDRDGPDPHSCAEKLASAVSEATKSGIAVLTAILIMMV